MDVTLISLAIGNTNESALRNILQHRISIKCVIHFLTRKLLFESMFVCLICVRAGAILSRT